MKKRKLISLLLVVVFILAMVPVVATASTVTLEALNPLGEIDIQDNMPLTSRARFQDANGNPDFTDRVIGLSWYTKTNNPEAMRALGDVFRARFPEAIVVEVTPLGSPWNEKSDANYDLWAGVTNVPGLDRPLDAVVFGVSD